ncbi:MAG: hypothetical protein ACI4NE_02740 [Succinivibrio sp.]
MRIKPALLVCLLIPFFVVCAEDTPQNDSLMPRPKMNDSFYEEVVERGYTVTTFKVPSVCKTKELASTCSVLKNHLVDRFEHDYIGYITDVLTESDSDETATLLGREKAIQHINIEFQFIKKFNFLGVVLTIHQQFKEYQVTFTEVSNYNLTTRKQILFNDLFNYPEIAKSICVDKIYKRFHDQKAPKLSLTLAQIELSPKNFMILPDGIVFIFDPTLVTNSSKTVRFMVRLEDLEKAEPVKSYFPYYLKDYKPLPPPPGVLY